LRGHGRFEQTMIPRFIAASLQSAVLAVAARTRGRLLRYRRVIVVATHLAAPVATSYCAFWLRFDGDVPAREAGLWLQMLPWLVGIRAISFIPARLYEGLWRYTSVWDVKNLVFGVLAGTSVFYAVVRWQFGLVDYPRSVFIIDSMLLIFLLGGLRLLPRVYRDFVRHGSGKRVLIFGAGDAGEAIVREMLKETDRQPVGFLDDDPRKAGRRIHGVRVLGTQADLPRSIALTRPDEVLVAVSRREVQLVQSLVRVLQPFKVPITIIPAMRHLIDGKVAVSQIRKLSIEDLLARPPIGLDDGPVRRLIEGKCVMVTGAGGSIGSELCRQIADFRPSRLILFERYENGLYAVAHDLQERAPEVPCESVIGDVGDERRLDDVLALWKPALILHAAAHKHVPLMEHNCCEAVKNNVLGTRRVAEAARRHGIERFVLISSDKAVAPSSVMGATKRIAELSMQALARPGGTRFTSVRFGNVLGSNGSVVPRFLQQIQNGGPVTVTHPEMERYFMLISEAVQLVLHAAALGEGDDLYVLDMGEQVKLVDLARNLIRLSGFVPDEEIKIAFVGLRPGEKLSEELSSEDEVIEPSPVEKVQRVLSSVRWPAAELDAQITVLIRLARQADAQGVIEQLCRIVPTFRPDPNLLRRVAGPKPDRMPGRETRPSASREMSGVGVAR
jgi:FlaA1/EpsC-like NDP-sugar epimerase